MSNKLDGMSMNIEQTEMEKLKVFLEDFLQYIKSGINDGGYGL